MTCSARTLALIIAALEAGAAFPPGGKILFSDGAGAYRSSLETWSPARVPNSSDFSYARWSHDGKLIGGWANGRAFVMNADGSGRVEVAASSPLNSYAKRVEWARSGKWDYELLFLKDRLTLQSTEIIVRNGMPSKGVTRTIMNVSGLATTRVDGNSGLNGFFHLHDRHLFVRFERDGWLVELPDQNTLIDKSNIAKYRSPFIQQTCQSSLSPDGAMVQYLQNTDQDQWWPGQKGPHKGFVIAPWTPVGATTNPITNNSFVLYNTPAELGETTIQGCRWSNHMDYLALTEQSGSSRHIWVVRLSDKKWTRVSASAPLAINVDLYFPPSTRAVGRSSRRALAMSPKPSGPSHMLDGRVVALPIGVPPGVFVSTQGARSRAALPYCHLDGMSRRRPW